jgi:hypothetical protein
MPAPGILSTILDTTGQRVQERLDQSQKMDQEMRDTQTKALLQSIYATDEQGAPKLSDREAEEAWSRIEKLHGHNKAAKDIIAKAVDITSKIFHKGRNSNPAMAGRVQDQTAQALSGGGGGPLVQAPPAGDQSSVPGPGSDEGAAAAYTGLTPPPEKTSSMPTPGPAAPAAAAPVAQAATPPPARTSTVAMMRAGAPPNPIKTEIDKEGRADVTWTKHQAILHKDKLEEIAKTAAAHGDKKIAQYIGDDGMLHMVFQSTDSENGISTYETDSEGKVRPFVSRLSPGSHLSVSDAKSLSRTIGQQFLDETGQPLDVNKLDIKQELIPITGGTPNRYKVATQNQKTMEINNMVVAVPTLEQTNPQAQTELGQARVGTVGTQETPFVNAAGNTELIQTQSTSTPAGPNLPAAAPGVQSREVPGAMQSSERNNQLQIARPVRAAAVQIFGDPANPDVESLESFAKLADSAQSRARVGTAARMIINDLTAADKAGGVAASILGTGASVGGGSVWGALKNWTGFTSVVSSQQAKATDAAVQALTPEEGRFLNQIMAAYGTVVGLRSLTRGGAYKFSVDSMERELPIPGISDVSNSTIYYNKLAKIANEIVEGTKGISTTVLPEQEQYRAAAARLNALGQGKAPGGLTPPPARTGPAAAAPAAGAKVMVEMKDGQRGVISATQLDKFLSDNPGSKRVTTP